jgi:hypothetical protein
MAEMERELVSTPTLSAVELDCGETVSVKLLGGGTRTVKLLDTKASVKRRGRLPYRDADGVIRYQISCRLKVDGQVVSLVRQIPSQDNFRDPPTVMGLHLWLDAVAGIDAFLTSHGTTACFPRKACRLAVWDATQRICPPLVHPWCPLPEGSLRVEQCYRGEDVWLGPYDGAECHGGLDINHPAGTPLWTPVSIHEHELFDSTTAGANNNRWRGLHHWPDGKTWLLQSHHLTRLLVPEGEPIEAGVHYAEGAGVHNGSHEHSHFAFGIREGDMEYLLDPWLLFWQMYRDRDATGAR